MKPSFYVQNMKPLVSESETMSDDTGNITDHVQHTAMITYNKPFVGNNHFSSVSFEAFFFQII